MTVLPRQLGGTDLVPCDSCGHWLHADTAHLAHHPECQFTKYGLCRCGTGRIVCANCCTQCNNDGDKLVFHVFDGGESDE